MNFKKPLVLALSTAAVVSLSACGGSTLGTDEYVTTYGAHFETLDYLTSSSATDSKFFANLVDGLVENDKYGTIVPSLAKEIPTPVRNSDGTQTWTFELRDDISWYTSKKTEYADVVAQDWVDSAKYLLNPANNSGTYYIYTEFIDGSSEYYYANLYKQDKDAYDALTDKGDAKEPILANYGFSSQESYTKALDFDNVGVKAINDKTLEFTTYEEFPYFLSALTYSCFLPVNGQFLKDSGSSFGLNQNEVLVNGAFFMNKNTKDSVIELTKNQNYWDKDEIKVNRVEFKYYSPDNTDNAFTRKLYEGGQLSAFTVLERDSAGWEKYVTGPNNTDGEYGVENPYSPVASTATSSSSTAYYMLYNFNRSSYSSNSTKTEAQKAATTAAVRNTAFRQGITYAVDTVKYLEKYNPSTPEQWAKRTFTITGLCEYNGKDYVEYIYDAYARNESSVSTSAEAKDILEAGQDGVFNVERAKAYFAQAKTELQSEGVTNFPIIIDVVGETTEEDRAVVAKFANAFNSVDPTFVQMNVCNPSNNSQWTQWSNNDKSYDLRLFMGWGPDYADPYTFLSTYSINGTMLEYSGLSGTTAADDALRQEILGDFDTKLAYAHAYKNVNQMNDRYRAFGEAEYELLFGSALIIPYINVSGSSVIVSKVKPYCAIRAPYGLSSDKFKGMELLEEALTAAERDQLKAEYEANRPDAN